MTTAIRVLHLEDDPADAQRIGAGLQAEDLACDIAWVQTREDFIAALQRQAFDLVLCDYEVGGLELLRQVLQQQPGILLIVMSAELLTEEEGVECMKAGATDYVIKRRLRRLGYSVRRAIAERQHMAALRQVEDDLRALNADLEARVHLRTAELETANAFLNSVIQHIPYQVIVKNANDLKIVRVNRSVEELTGRSQQELLGKTVHDFVSSKEEADFFTAKDKEALALGREVDIPEETLHTRDGSVRVLHAKKIPILDEAGQPRYVLTMSEDVTERKKKEREIERLNAALAQRSAEVEAANRAKSTFLATMSHEIRTPMNGMLGMLELLSLTELDAEQRETLGLVRESSRSLLRIIDDILDFSKIEAGKLEVRPEVVSIKRLIEEVQSIYLGNASSKGLIVRRMVDPRISPALRVDPVRLRQILNNFVSNAIKFTSEGWIDINVQWLGRAEGQENLRFEVKDTGIGISPEDQQRLFQPFSQADGDEARRRPGGTGLGLVISRQLAQMMGGSISLESEPGKGTTITLELSLPIAEPLPGSDADGARALPAATAMRRMAPGTAQAETEGTLVLLVDDHPVNRMLLLRQVRTLGYAAQTADDGVQALEMWKSGRFGLVITDCHMPHMDGYELARSIRSAGVRRGARARADHRLHRQRAAGGGRGVLRRRHGRLPGQAGGTGAADRKARSMAAASPGPLAARRSRRLKPGGRPLRQPDRPGAPHGEMRWRRVDGGRGSCSLPANLRGRLGRTQAGGGRRRRRPGHPVRPPHGGRQQDGRCARVRSRMREHRARQPHRRLEGGSRRHVGVRAGTDAPGCLFRGSQGNGLTGKSGPFDFGCRIRPLRGRPSTSAEAPSPTEDQRHRCLRGQLVIGAQTVGSTERSDLRS